jgi:hypothetical protein
LSSAAITPVKIIWAVHPKARVFHQLRRGPEFSAASLITTRKPLFGPIKRCRNENHVSEQEAKSATISLTATRPSNTAQN